MLMFFCVCAYVSVQPRTFMHTRTHIHTLTEYYTLLYDMFLNRCGWSIYNSE